jgi:hypothetical protein
MSRAAVQWYLAVAALAILGLGLVGCGGGGNASAGETADASADTDVATTTETADVDSTEANDADAGAGGPAPAPGKGTLELDDGRSFAISVTRCNLGESDGTLTAGSFEVAGTSGQGSTFEMTQFYLNDSWSQSDASIKFPNADQIYVLASAAGGAEPATVEGKSIAWTQTFKELDESANSHVYTGEGTLRLTCP